MVGISGPQEMEHAHCSQDVAARWNVPGGCCVEQVNYGFTDKQE